MAEIIDFKEAKERVVLKKSALREFRDKFLSNNKILYIPIRPKNFGCPKCRNVSLIFDNISIRCRLCVFYSRKYGECPHCHGDKIVFRNTKMCLQCWARFDEIDLSTY